MFTRTTSPRAMNEVQHLRPCASTSAPRRLSLRSSEPPRAWCFARCQAKPSHDDSRQRIIMECLFSIPIACRRRWPQSKVRTGETTNDHWCSVFDAGEPDESRARGRGRTQGVLRTACVRPRVGRPARCGRQGLTRWSISRVSSAWAMRAFFAAFSKAFATVTSSDRRYRSPAFVIQPRRFALPPELYCPGTIPNQAASWRPHLYSC